MAKTSPAAAAAEPQVVYLTPPTGGADGVPYEGPQRRVGPASAVPPGSRILGPAEEVAAQPGAAPVTDLDGHPVD